MTARILLVTGSRAFVSTPHEAPRARAQALLVAFCDVAHPTLIVCGDAEGPDDWAAMLATHNRLDLRVYGLDGTVCDGGRVLRRWAPEPSQGARFNPLDRNAAMVRETAAQRARGAHVEVLAIEAAWSATKGTAHTVAQAEKEGLAVTRISIGE
jgi:hypothetical protein